MSGSVDEGDYQGLVDLMARLMAVKDKQTTADHMFEPLTQTIELLKTYQQELPDAVHLQLQVSYLKLTTTFDKKTKQHNITQIQKLSYLEKNELPRVGFEPTTFCVQDKCFITN